MIRVYLDTNIIMDLLANREHYHEDASKIFSLADQKKINITCSALSFANIHYILLKNKRSEHANAILRNLTIIINVLALDEKIIKLALNDTLFNDFEDAIQYYTAIQNKAEVILTRNRKDFKNTLIPIMDSNEFVKNIENQIYHG